MPSQWIPSTEHNAKLLNRFKGVWVCDVLIFVHVWRMHIYKLECYTKAMKWHITQSKHIRIYGYLQQYENEKCISWLVDHRENHHSTQQQLCMNIENENCHATNETNCFQCWFKIMKCWSTFCSQMCWLLNKWMGASRWLK